MKCTVGASAAKILTSDSHFVEHVFSKLTNIQNYLAPVVRNGIRGNISKALLSFLCYKTHKDTNKVVRTSWYDIADFLPV